MFAPVNPRRNGNGIWYEAPLTLVSCRSARNSIIKLAASDTTECCLCLSNSTQSSILLVRTTGCGHVFHEKCLDNFMGRTTISSLKCPICHNQIGEPQGFCPSGLMETSEIAAVCPGFSTNCIEISYTIPLGVQLPYHQNPGRSYQATSRAAYLPNNVDGSALLQRLYYAWDHGLTFSIGTSETTGRSDSVVWGTIPHKTSLRFGQFGFPDHNYIASCNTSLDALNIPDARTCFQIHSSNNPFNTASKTFESRNTTTNEFIRYDAPSSFTTRDTLANFFQSITPPQEECVICFEPLSKSKAVLVRKCNHIFHEDCINDAMKVEPKCPICRKRIGDIQGRSPSGTMAIEIIPQACPGFSPRTAIQITYAIPSGVQQPYHENPGCVYGGTERVAYLPNTQEGLGVLKRLKYAWKHGLIFAIGTSLTTGRNNSVVWSSIHHKTSLHGGAHGWPDANYLVNCNEALSALGVPDVDSCS